MLPLVSALPKVVFHLQCVTREIIVWPECYAIVFFARQTELTLPSRCVLGFLNSTGLGEVLLVMTLYDTIARTAGQTTGSRAHLVTADVDLFNRPVLTAHVTTGVGTAKERRSVLGALRGANTGMKCRLKQHQQQKFEAARTLEDFVGRYGQSEIVFDPTQVVSRTRALVTLACDIRTAFNSDEVIGTYLDAEARTIYVVLDPSRFFTDHKITGGDILAAEARTKDAISTYLENDACIARNVLLSFEMPPMALVPVDKASFFDLGDVAKSKFGRLNMGAVVALVSAFGATSLAADPAVSGFNAKLSIDGSTTRDDIIGDNDTTLLSGSATMPLGERFGFQLDGVLGSTNGDNVQGLGGHLFWRDPSVALVGLTFGIADIDRGAAATDQKLRQIGAEAEFYINDFTIYASAGRQSGDNVLEGTYGALGLGWYATDNLELALDLSTTPDNDSITTVGLEWQPAFNAANNISIFADASVGSNDFESYSVGFRMYFGGSRTTLAGRHRYDDPKDNIARNLVRYRPNSLGNGTPSAPDVSSPYGVMLPGLGDVMLGSYTE